MHPLTPTTSGKRNDNLRSVVLERIRTDITTGMITEGTVLSTPTLATQLGVSTTPVREAMMDLAADGLIETVKNKGFRVTSMSTEALDHMTQVRLLLEPPAMHHINPSMFANRHRHLLNLADACTTAAQQHELSAYLSNDREFHVQLLECTGNPELVHIATTLRRRTRMYGLTALARSGQLAIASREHHELLDNIHQNDTHSAEQLMHQHISHARGMWATGEVDRAVDGKVCGPVDDATAAANH